MSHIKIKSLDLALHVGSGVIKLGNVVSDLGKCSKWHWTKNYSWSSTSIMFLSTSMIDASPPYIRSHNHNQTHHWLRHKLTKLLWLCACQSAKVDNCPPSMGPEFRSPSYNGNRLAHSSKSLLVTHTCQITYRQCPCKSSYLNRTKLFRRHKKQISTTVAAFFIIIFSAPIFELINTINSRISFFKSFLKIVLLLLTRFCTSECVRAKPLI